MPSWDLFSLSKHLPEHGEHQCDSWDVRRTYIYHHTEREMEERGLRGGGEGPGQHLRVGGVGLQEVLYKQGSHKGGDHGGILTPT